MNFIGRRMVTAWQIRTPSVWRPPGGDNPQVMPEGTWVVEAIGSGERWAVAPHLFWNKYKLVRRKTAFTSIYLNVEPVRFEAPGEDKYVVSEEGIQRLGTGDVIAVGVGGDRWPVPADRVANTYRRDTPLNRMRLIFTPGRTLHVLGRALGLVLLLASLLLMIVSALVLVSSNPDQSPSAGPNLVRTFSMVVVFLPVVGWMGLRWSIPSLLRPSFLSALFSTGAWLVVCWFLLGVGAGLDVYESLQESLRIFTATGLPDVLSGQKRIFSLTGQLAATTIAFLAFVAVGRALLRRSWDNLVARLGSFDVVIWGLGATGMRLIEELRSDVTLYDTAQRVVVVDRDPTNPRIRRAQDLGVSVLIDRGNTVQLLRRLATSPFRLRWTANRIVALTNDIATNLQVAEAVDTRKAKQKAVAVMIRANSLWSQEGIRTRPIPKERAIHTLTFSSFASCAEKVLTQIRQSTVSVQVPRPVVIIGFSQIAVALLDALRTESVLRRTYVEAISRAGVRTSQSGLPWSAVYWITEPGSRHMTEELLPADVELTLGRENGPAALRVNVYETADPFGCDVSAVTGAGTGPRAIVLCGPDAPTAATRFFQPVGAAGKEEGRGWLVFVEAGLNNQAGMDMGYAVGSSTSRGPVPMVASDGLMTPVSYFDGEVGVVAGAVHEFFRTTKDRSQEQRPDPANQEWTSPWLDADKRRDTYLWVQNALNWLNEDHRLVVRPVSAGSVPSTPEGWASIAERMAQREHEDWCRRNNRDQPWETLAQREKTRNRLPFTYFPDLLSACRLELRRVCSADNLALDRSGS